MTYMLTTQARGDERLKALGPERFVRWDLSDLQEAKAALDAEAKQVRDLKGAFIPCGWGAIGH